MNGINNKKRIKNTYKTHISYSLGSFFDDFLATVLSFMVFKFYETEIFLPVFYISLGVVIYGIWNMINDPLVGIVSNKNIGFMKKRGKRFTWFLLTSIPCSVVFSIIFLPPTINPLITFLFLLISMCLLDTLFSFTSISWQSIFPDKFRSHKERTKVGGIQILCSLFGLALGTILPTLLITEGIPGTNIESYITVGLIVSITLVIVAIFMLYGMKEHREMINRSFRGSNKSVEKKSYFKKLLIVLKQKNYTAYLTAYLAQSTVMVLMLASLPYWMQYVVNIDPVYETLILIVFLLASVSSAPLWIKISRKYGNRIGYMCGTLGSGISLIITMLIWSFPYILIGFGLIGFSMGATWTLLYPTFSDVIDEIVIKAKIREEGIYYGFRTFIGRFSIVIQALTFGIIHYITFFDPTATSQTLLAQWGINIGMFAVPAIFYFLGFILMWMVYDLKPEKVEKNKVLLRQLDL